MRFSTPADSAAGVPCASLGGGTVPILDGSMPCSRAMMVSTFRDRSADDECEDECEHGKPFHDRRRRHRDPKDRRLALAGIDRGSTALALQDADEEHGHPHPNPDPEQAG